MPRVERAGLELMNVFLQYNPTTRISATEALAHRYFDPIAAARGLGADVSIYSQPSIIYKPVLPFDTYT